MGETYFPEINCVYVDTSLDTHLGIFVHHHETISDFKEKLCKEHQQCFPEVGEINISAVKVKRQNTVGLLLDYHLPDSMYLSMVFEGIVNNCWFVFVDAVVRRVDKGELAVIMDADANCSNHELLEQNKEIANDFLLLDGYTKNQNPEDDLETEVAEKTTKKRKLKFLDGVKSRKKPSVDLNQSDAATTASRFDVDESHELRGNVQVQVVATESSPREKLDDILTEATGKEIEMGEKSVEDAGRDKIETDNLVSHPENHLDTNSGLTNRLDTEKKKRRKKRSKDDINQSSAAAISTLSDIVNEINGVPANVDRVDATPESLPISRGENLDLPFTEASQKENEMGDNSVDDVGRDKIETDNLVSHTEYHLDTNSELTTRQDTEKKKRRKKRSKDDINQSSAAAITTLRDIVNDINEVPANVDTVDATLESHPNSRGKPFAESSQKENEMVEKSVEDVGRDNTETDSHLDANSGLTTRPDKEKKKRRKKGLKDDINQSSAATTTSGGIANEINGVPGNVDRVDAISESLLISRREDLGNPSTEARQKETEMGEKTDGNVGKAIPNATDNIHTNNVEINAGMTKSVKSTKKRKSKNAKTPAEEDTLVVASDAQNVEPIRAVDGEEPDNVIRNILDCLQEKNETEENLDKIGKKSSKKSKKKHSLKVAGSQVLSVEVNNAALEETPLIKNPQDTDTVALFTPAKKDTEIDASLLKKSSEVADNSLSKKILIDTADMGDNFGCSQKDDDIVGGGKRQDQVTSRAKSKKEKKGLDLHPNGSIDGSLSSMKPKEKKGRAQQAANSGTSLLQSMVKNDRSGSVRADVVNSKKEDVKKSSKSLTVDKRKTNFFEDAEKCNSSEDESNKTFDVSTKTPSDYSSDNDSDVTSMSRKQGNNLGGGTNKFSGSLQDILRRSSSYKKALIRAQSQPDILDDVDCVPDSQAV